MAILGAPDLALITLSELVEQVRRICRASSLPLLVDADHGYGNALNVMRTVEELEIAGAAGLTIEDTVLPAAFDLVETHLISIEEAEGKLRAALSGRQDPALVILGRTSAPKITGIDDTIARCRMFEAVGSDAIFVSGLERREDLEKIRFAVRLPLVLGTVTKELDDAELLTGAGVRIALQGHEPIRAAAQAAYQALQASRGIDPSRQTDFRTALNTMIQRDEYEQRQRMFLRRSHGFSRS
jgi:carboxyvinyl-carboxyphosphonate phosphorylmutase